MLFAFLFMLPLRLKILKGWNAEKNVKLLQAAFREYFR